LIDARQEGRTDQRPRTEESKLRRSILVSLIAGAALIVGLAVSAHAQGGHLLKTFSNGAVLHAESSPKPSDSPEPAESPEASPSAEPAEKPEPAEAPEASPSPEAEQDNDNQNQDNNDNEQTSGGDGEHQDSGGDG
jgi:cytoskeletal protein RodZ